MVVSVMDLIVKVSENIFFELSKTGALEIHPTFSMDMQCNYQMLLLIITAYQEVICPLYRSFVYLLKSQHQPEFSHFKLNFHRFSDAHHYSPSLFVNLFDICDQAPGP